MQMMQLTIDPLAWGNTEQALTYCESAQYLSSIRYKGGLIACPSVKLANIAISIAQRCVPYKKIGDKSLASAIASYSSNLVRFNTLLYDYGVLHCVGSGILQSERIRKMRCQGKRAIYTSSNFRTFLGVLTPSGIGSDTDMLDRPDQSA
jgi:hypothetical protein